ncbi:hypothetical protein, partial [Kaistella sp.]|uniref:hypothetical protein n=1 Tax=Kaistella sp. TaxID=2782235 RepID=UPI002F94F03F
SAFLFLHKKGYLSFETASLLCLNFCFLLYFFKEEAIRLQRIVLPPKAAIGQCGKNLIFRLSCQNLLPLLRSSIIHKDYSQIFCTLLTSFHPSTLCSFCGHPSSIKIQYP